MFSLPLFLSLKPVRVYRRGKGKVKAERRKKTRERREEERARSSGKQMPMKAAHPANITQAYHYQRGTDQRSRRLLRIQDFTYRREYVPIHIHTYIYILYTWSRQRSLLPPRALLGNSIRKPGRPSTRLKPRPKRRICFHGRTTWREPPPQDTTVAGREP